ncbi:hypothetical protein BC628DRAFT_945970 [Trametes gibbosa]|nr:hypothetical protein BC628DRAFT_945970 [Trametes gibbosa]
MRACGACSNFTWRIADLHCSSPSPHPDSALSCDISSSVNAAHIHKPPVCMRTRSRQLRVRISTNRCMLGGPRGKVQRMYRASCQDEVDAHLIDECVIRLTSSAWLRCGLRMSNRARGAVEICMGTIACDITPLAGHAGCVSRSMQRWKVAVADDYDLLGLFMIWPASTRQ